MIAIRHLGSIYKPLVEGEVVVQAGLHVLEVIEQLVEVQQAHQVPHETLGDVLRLDERLDGLAEPLDLLVLEGHEILESTNLGLHHLDRLTVALVLARIVGIRHLNDRESERARESEIGLIH